MICKEKKYVNPEKNITLSKFLYVERKCYGISLIYIINCYLFLERLVFSVSYFCNLVTSFTIPVLCPLCLFLVVEWSHSRHTTYLMLSGQLERAEDTRIMALPTWWARIFTFCDIRIEWSESVVDWGFLWNTETFVEVDHGEY